MVATQENASISSLTHSLSSIWEFESKISTSDTVSIAGSLISEIDDGNINQNIKAMDPPGTVSPHCAASFYSSSNPSTKMCSSVAMLNEYLRARKDDITAGVPGMLLFAVIGQEDAGLIFHSISWFGFLFLLNCFDVYLIGVVCRYRICCFHCFVCLFLK